MKKFVACSLVFFFLCSCSIQIGSGSSGSSPGPTPTSTSSPTPTPTSSPTTTPTTSPSPSPIPTPTPVPTPTTRYVEFNFPQAYAGSTGSSGIYILNGDLSQQLAFANYVANSFPNIHPAPYAAAPINSSSTTTLTFVVPNTSSSTGYYGCNVIFNPDGSMATQQSNNSFSHTCIGFTSESNDDPFYDHSPLPTGICNVAPTINQPITIPSGVLTSQVASQAIPRTFTFRNSSNYDICLVRDDNNPNHSAPTPNEMCDINGPSWQQSLIPAHNELVIPIPVSGWDSAAWAVVGYRISGSSTWLQTGFTGIGNSLFRNQAATKIEPTIFPYYPNGVSSGPILNSLGETSVDISSVDGANLTYSFYPRIDSNSTGICNITNSDVAPNMGTHYSGVFYQDFPLTYFSNPNSNNAMSCSDSQNIYTDGAGNNVGCMSSCTLAKATPNTSQVVQDQYCCEGAMYGSAESCSATTNPHNPSTTFYVGMINTTFPATYGFAFDDGIANFFCDPFTSFIFDITGVGPTIISN